MRSTLRMSATYEHVVDGVFICDADFVLEIGFCADRNGEVSDYWIDNIGTSHYDALKKCERETWIAEKAWRDPFIKAALEYFRSSKFGEIVQEKANEELALERV
jgi:hypothetical protein